MPFFIVIRNLDSSDVLNKMASVFLIKKISTTIISDGKKVNKFWKFSLEIWTAIYDTIAFSHFPDSKNEC